MPTANKYWPEVRSTRQGSIGHTHALARKGIAKVFELLGGEQGLWKWAMEDDKNKFAFYTILLPKLIPAELAEQGLLKDTRIQVMVLPATAPASTPTPVLDSNPNHVLPAEPTGGCLPQPGGPHEDSDV